MTAENGEKQGWKRLRGPALILLVAAVATAPQLFRGPSCGHDFDFHLVTWLDCLNSWKHGVLYPRWAPSPNFGAGEPRFIFYPPLTWMLGAALGAVLPWVLAPVAMIFLFLALTGLATRALALEALEEGAATLAGCVAIFSGYVLFNAYERTAFAEMTAGFWIPLLLLYALRDRAQGAGRAFSPGPQMRGTWGTRALTGAALPLSLVIAGTWLSNPPVGIMAVYLLAAVAFVAAVTARSWAPLVRAAVSTALGAGAAMFFLLPARLESRWVDPNAILNDPGEKVEANWLFARHADPSLALHDIELRKVSIIAVAMLAIAIAGLLVSWQRGRLKSGGRWWIPLALIPFAVLMLLLPVSLPVWNRLPYLRLLQFPWRWLAVLNSPMALFLAAAVWREGRRWRATVTAVCAAVFACAAVYAGIVYYQPCDEEDSVAGTLAAHHAGTGFEGYSEYEPPGTDDEMIARGLPDACLTSDSNRVLGRTGDDGALEWSPAEGSCVATFHWQTMGPERMRLTAAVPRAGFLILRLCSYPAWRLRLNGAPLVSLPPRADGLIAVPVQAGNVDLAVDWGADPGLAAGRWLSLLSVLLLAALALLNLRRPRARLE